MKNIPTKVCSKAVSSQYEKLVMLKKALQVSDEVSENILIEKAQEQNLLDVYFIGYLVDRVMNAPIEVKKQNDLLIDCYDEPSKYAQTKKEMKKLFRTNPIFMKYAMNMCSELDLLSSRSCALTNTAIFGIAHNVISEIVTLEKRNVFLNLHILQKWLQEQRQVDFRILNNIEKMIILYLANGYRFDEIVTEYATASTNTNEEDLKTILYDDLPTQFNVQSPCQFMAILFANNPDLCDMEKSQILLEDLSENNEF